MKHYTCITVFVIVIQCSRYNLETGEEESVCKLSDTESTIGDFQSIYKVSYPESSSSCEDDESTWTSFKCDSDSVVVETTSLTTDSTKGVCQIDSLLPIVPYCIESTESAQESCADKEEAEVVNNTYYQRKCRKSWAACPSKDSDTECDEFIEEKRFVDTTLNVIKEYKGLSNETVKHALSDIYNNSTKCPYDLSYIMGTILTETCFFAVFKKEGEYVQRGLVMFEGPYWYSVLTDASVHGINYVKQPWMLETLDYRVIEDTMKVWYTTAENDYTRTHNMLRSIFKMMEGGKDQFLSLKLEDEEDMDLRRIIGELCDKYLN